VHSGIVACDWCAGGRLLVLVGKDGLVQRWSWDPNLAHKGNPFKLEALHVSLRSHLTQIQAASSAEDVAKGVGKGLLSIARGFKAAAVSAIKTGDAIATATNMVQIFSQQQPEAVMPAGGQASAAHSGRGTTVMLERFKSDAALGRGQPVTGRPWSRQASSSLLLRAGDADGCVWCVLLCHRPSYRKLTEMRRVRCSTFLAPLPK